MSTVQQTRHAGFGQAFTRASALPLTLFLAVLTYLVPTAIFSGPTVLDERPATPVVWKAAYSERYPGCVSTVLWPAGEQPVALVVVDADGLTTRVSQAEARSLAADGGLARTIGACR